jgi:hypothetical protein
MTKAGVNVAVRRDLERVLVEGDRALGVDVLVPLRVRLGAAPGRADLDGMWKQLGVSRSGGKMVFDDRAPLASVRKGIAGAR